MAHLTDTSIATCSAREVPKPTAAASASYNLTATAFPNAMVAAILKMERKIPYVPYIGFT